MLEFFKDGKSIKISPIFAGGVVGQTVIFGENVNWGNLSPQLAPLCGYSCPTIFTIIKKDPTNGYYILSDSAGKRVKIQYLYHSSGAEYLYDAKEWLKWNDMHTNEKLSRKQRKIEQLEGHVDLLKDILVKQGTRIVSETEANSLGLN